MKGIKRILLSIGIISSSIAGLFTNCTPVKAESYAGQAIWPSEYISNVYIKKIRADGTGKYQQGRFIRRSEDNAFVYCLQPFVDIDNNYVYQVARSDYEVYLNMSQEQFRKISLYAYYGYGYGNHTDLKWYALTQVLVWRTADPSSQFFFTDTLNGNRNDSLFASEIAEIESLVNSHYVKPNFSNAGNIKLPITNTISVNDVNGKLNEYRITEQHNVSASINGNTLNITGTGIGSASIKMTKTDSKYSVPPVVYFNDHSQNVFRLGSYDPLEVNLNLEVIGGKVGIQKVDSESLRNNAQGNATLKGAVYGVYKEDGTKLAEITTDENGYAKSNYLSSIGRLHVQEIKPSTGYKLDSNKYYVELKEGNLEPTVQVKEDVIKGKIKVTKFDNETNACKAQGEATLKGAKYKVLNSNGDVVDTLTIGDDCTATTKDLPYGNYRVVEESSSVGYYLDTNSYNVFINNESVFNVTSKEQVIKGKIKVNKVDKENNSCKAQGQATLKGAIYEILDLKGNVVDTITIGDDCSATSKYLPYGHYKIKEKTQSKGYYIDTEIYNANITEDNVINITSKEQVIKNYISILKQYDYVNETTQFLNAEANIRFEIFYPDGTKFGEMTTDKNGYATMNIPYGVWKFHQVNSTTGFEKIYDFFITVDENSNKEQYYNILNNALSAYLQLIKKDSETGKSIKLADTTFRILNTDTNKFVSQYVGGKVISEFKTDENGIMITQLKLSSGNYRIVEITSPKGYLLDESGVPFTIGSDTHFNYTTYGAFVVVEYLNTTIKGQIEINKDGEVFKVEDGTFSYENKPLSGIEFQIIANEDIKTPDGNYIYYNKGDVVETLITDNNGYVISKKLPLGKYILVETKTKENYILNTEEYSFELTEKDNKTPIVYKSYSALNKYKKGTLEFSKTDLVNGEEIPNTKIEIYTENDELIYSGITNEQGKVVVKDIPVNQKMYIIESEAATGYVITNEKVFFIVKENGEVVKAEMKNKPITSTLEFTKTDISTDEPLPNTLIEIYKKDTNELVFSGRTDENGKIVIDELRYGDYVLYEKEAPESYQINEEPMYFSVKEDGKVIKAEMKDKKITGTLEFTKTDISTSEPLPNTLIEIYKKDTNELVFSGRTDENGKIVIEDLVYGDYVLYEKEAPESYQLNEEPMYFSIKEQGEIVKCTMTDERIVEVPNTESNDYYVIEIIGGILLVMGSGVIIYANKKTKED